MMKTYGHKTFISKLRENLNTDKIKFSCRKRTFYKQYGRVIPVSVGLLIGFAIDKALFILTKGISLVIPPFSAMLLGRGYCFKLIRVDDDYGKFEFIVKHFVRK